MLDLDKSTWTRVQFGDVATQSKEKVDPSEGSVERYVAGEHMDTDDLKIHRWGEVGDGYLGPAFHRRFRPGQILYGSRRTYLRKVAVADFDGVCANTTFVIDAKPEQISPRFLPLVMTSEPFHAHAIAESKGSVNPYVNWPDIAKYEFDLPPLDKQERIAELFWAAEEHRRKLAAMRVAIGSPAQGQPATWSALLQKHLDHAAATWGRRPLSEVGDLTRGRRFTKTDYVDEGIGCVHYGQIYTHFGAVATRPLTYLPEEMGPRLRFAEPGDLLIAGTSEDVADVCKSVAWMGEGRVAVHDDCFILRHHLDPRYASYFFASPDFQSQKLSFVSASKVVRVSATNLSRTQIPVPPMKVQEVIVEELGQVLDAWQVLAGEVSRVRGLSDAILAQVFGGS